MPVTSRHKRLDWACLGSVTAVLAHSVPALAVPAPVASKPAAQARFPAKPPTGPFAERTAKLIAEGRAALEAKDFPKAQRSFEQAYWFRSTPDLLYLLGQVADAQGQNVTALDFFRRYLESGSQSTDEATTEALRKRIQEVPATSSEVTISGHGGGLLSVDGRLLGVLPLHRALLLTPGPHRFKIEWKGAHFESDPLLIPESRTAELHLTPGTAGSLIAVLTLNSFAVLKLSSTDLPPEQHKTVEESITTAARNEHTVFLPDAKLRELLQAEPQGCLDDTPCLDRIASKAEIRYVVRVALSGQQSAPTVAAAAELVDVASGLAAGRIEENLPRDSLGPQTIALIRRLFQTALGRPRGMLHIESTPSESIVRIDDRVLGKTPLDRVSLAGKHRLHVEQRGFVPFDSDITLEPGQTAQIAATLTAKEQPPPPPPPEFVTIPGESSRSRIARYVLGGAASGLGVALVGLGGWALSQNGQCGDNPAPQNGIPCELVYNTSTVGRLLIGSGIGLTVGGSLLMLLPGRRPKQVLKSALTP